MYKLFWQIAPRLCIPTKSTTQPVEIDHLIRHDDHSVRPSRPPATASGAGASY